MHYIIHRPWWEAEWTPFSPLSQVAVLLMSHISGWGGPAAWDNTGLPRDQRKSYYVHIIRKKIHPLNHRKNSSKISAWTKNSMICVLPDGKEGVERVVQVDIPGFLILPVASFTIPESEGFVLIIWVPSG